MQFVAIYRLDDVGTKFLNIDCLQDTIAREAFIYALKLNSNYTGAGLIAFRLPQDMDEILKLDQTAEWDSYSKTFFTEMECVDESLVEFIGDLDEV